MNIDTLLETYIEHCSIYRRLSPHTIRACVFLWFGQIKPLVKRNPASVGVQRVCNNLERNVAIATG